VPAGARDLWRRANPINPATPDNSSAALVGSGTRVSETLLNNAKGGVPPGAIEVNDSSSVPVVATKLNVWYIQPEKVCVGMVMGVVFWTPVVLPHVLGVV
jgi:hypothetical protein